MANISNHIIERVQKAQELLAERKANDNAERDGEVVEELAELLASRKMIDAVRSAYGNACGSYLEEVLQELHEMQINVDIASFWDYGWRVRIGDERNGFLADHMVFDEKSGLEEIAPWLRSTAQRLYPHYARWRQRRIGDRAMGAERISALM
ncbi:MAG: hypothetical protein AB7E66_14070 [Parvibaculaceae bacterium]